MFLSYKKRFQTCLQMLDELRRQHTDLTDELLSYAGILDPMAEGWVSVLVGKEENQDRVRHTELVKEYVVDILVGVHTDSGDLMGVVDLQREFVHEKVKRHEIVQEIYRFPDRYSQQISKFANKKYKSKPLWWYQLHDIPIPDEAIVSREVCIHEREVMATRSIDAVYLADEINAMGEVFGTTFRMERILPSWFTWFASNNSTLQMDLISVRMVVSKGFFVRQWVQDLGEKVGVPLVVFNLKRTKVLDVVK